MSRYGGGKFTRDTSFSTYSNEEPSWAKDYIEAVEKYSVRSKKEDAAIFDQINSILGNTKSKYSSVEEAVLDMQKRTGLFDILQKKASRNEEDMFEVFPDLKDFIKNKIELFPGSAVSAICDSILQEPKYKNWLSAGEAIPDNVENYINKMKAEISPENEDTVDGKIDLDIDNSTLKSNNPLSVMNNNTF